MKIKLENSLSKLPSYPDFVEGIRRAPKRNFTLSEPDTRLALKNALRYIPEAWHEELAPEFLEELLTRGRIYGYRFRPAGGLHGKSIDEYKGNHTNDSELNLFFPVAGQIFGIFVGKALLCRIADRIDGCYTDCKQG